MPPTHPLRGFDIDPTIVRGYDVRGYVQSVEAGGKRVAPNLTPEVAEAFGRALGSELAVGTTVAVTSDHRHLSPELVTGLTRGFVRVGVSVLHNRPQPLYGGKPFMPTGALTWFLIKSKLDGAVQVTGSHNPPEFNGFKIALGREALFGDELARMVPIIHEGRFRDDVPESQRGRVTEVDMLGQFLAMLGHAFPRFRYPPRLVVDLGNGIGRVITPVLRDLGCEVIELFPEPDARFPNHPADPSSEDGTRALKEKVRSLNASQEPGERPWLGIALDGDSDRSGVVDERGLVVWPERMAAIFYAEYLREPAHKGHVLALDVRASNVVRDTVLAAGGQGVFIPAGYPAHRKFAKLDAPAIGKTPVGVSAEASGHFFFPTAALDEKGRELAHARELLIDDGIYSALRFLEIVDARGGATAPTVTELMSSLPTYFTSHELRVFAPDEQKAQVVDTTKRELVARYADALAAKSPMQVVGGMKVQAGDAAIVEVDGIRLQFADGAWLVVRISNTSPNLVLKFEARERARLAGLMRTVRELLAKSPEVELAPLDAELKRFA